ncbi:MAG TPA: hypothetical protein VFQ75_08195 [Candidatus Limnocylindrales bacterium]|jgi:hypothetical protein|nr:hypothetical protein [Candidatus Limnocylindrales bacterium]
MDEDRPFGIPLLGIISFLGGVVLAFIGIVLMGVIIFGDVPTGSGSFIAGALTFGVGMLFIAVAIGAWFTLPWARTVGLATAVLGLVAGVITLVTTGAIAHGIATFVFPIFLLWYLNRPKVKEAFRNQE